MLRAGHCLLNVVTGQINCCMNNDAKFGMGDPESSEKWKIALSSRHINAGLLRLR